MLIRTKLRIGYLVIFTLVVCIGLVMVWALRSWETAVQDLTFSHAQGLRAERLRGDLYRQIKEILDRFVSGDRSARGEFESLGVMVEGELADLQKHSQSSAEQDRIQELEVAHRQVTKLVREIFKLLENGAREQAIQRVERELEQVAFTRQDEQIDRLRAYYDAAAQQSMQRTRAVATQGELLAGVVVLLALAWGAGLLFGTQLWLVKPLQAIGRATAIISTGELTHRLQVSSQDELGELAASINWMAQSLKGIQERLLQAERLAAAGELSAYVAHNIRNPLASIRSTAQAALTGSDQSAAIRLTLQDVVEGVDRLNQWVRHFLFALKPITPALASADLNRVVVQALDIVRPTLEGKRIRVELSLAEALPLVPLDEGYFEQAFIALLTNACEATPHEGRIGIASRLVRDGEIPTGVAVELTDNGTGIPPEMIEKVLTPYFTTKSDGVGLGLTMAQKVASAHGGSLTVSNRQGGGAAVQILLPLPHPEGVERDG
jgi:signal transduction histidine kinase